MRWLSEVRERVRSVFLRGREDAEMDEELRDHLEREVAENVRLGMSVAEARRRALLSFGGMERIREEVREERGTTLYDELRADIRYALRGLRRSPAFTVVALLTLALGIGANAAMFSIVNGVLLRPLPYPDADRLVLLHTANERTGELHGGLSSQDLEDWAARTQALSDVAGHVTVSTIITGRGEPREAQLSYVTERFFPLLGSPVLHGRTLVDDDFRLRERSAVIGERLWRDVFGADARVVGGVLLLRGEPYTIVGVAPARMRQPTPQAEIWIPQALVRPNQFSNGMPQREHRYLQSIGRLMPGVKPAAAQAELTTIAAGLAAAHPQSNGDWTAATVVPLHAAVTGAVDEALFIVLAVVGFILLIGCANLANLLLARGSTRTREIAIRVALGAGRRRILRQLITESVVLALLGGVLGLLLSWWGVNSILAVSADTLPRAEDIRMDGRVLGFGVMLAVLTGILFGSAPAARLAGTDPQRNLRGGRGITSGDGRLRSALVVAEVAVAMLLVVGASLMARSFMALRNVDPGFDPDRVLTVSLQLNYAGVPEEEIATFLLGRPLRIVEALRGLPGVQNVGMINVFPLRDDFSFSLEYPRADAAPGSAGVLADTRYVDAGYLPTMGIPLLRGTGIPERLAADEATPVVLSESAARRLFGDEDPIGKRIRVPWGEAPVIGVAGDVRQLGLAQAPQPAVYFSNHRAPRLMTTFVLRTEGDPLLLAGPVRHALSEIDGNQPIRSIAPLTAVLAESIARDRFFTVLFALFGGLALVLAAVGIYGVLAYTVRQRTQEIGVRIALGADTLDVLRLVSGAGMKLVMLGIALGTIGALALSRVMASLLYGVAPTDAAAFAGAITFLLLIAFIATLLPARRAMRLPPMTALRPE